MPPAKRAPRTSARSADADPTPEVSAAAKKVAAKKATVGRAPAKTVQKPAARTAPVRTTAVREAPTKTAPVKAVPAEASPAKSAPAKAAPRAAAAAKAPARVSRAAQEASGAAAQAANTTAVRVGKAVGTLAAGMAGRAESAAEHAAETAERVAAHVASAHTGPAPHPETATHPETAASASASAATEQAPVQPTSTDAATKPRTFRGDEDPAAVRDTGRALRKHLRRQDLAAWSAPADRPDPIDVISETNADRLPSLIPLRWTRMLESPFAYLRGAAAVMANDLAGSATSGLEAQICGDAHVANFGLFATRERQQVIDVNDFDESLVGPWEFDVKRLAASIVVAGRVAGVKPKGCRTAVTDAVRVYREVAHALADLPVVAAWSASLEGELSKHIGIDDLHPVLKAVYGKARRNTSVRAAQRMATRHKNGGWRFRTDPPELTRLPESEAAPILAGLEEYATTLPIARQGLLRRYQPVDVALRVGGLGSIGLRTYAVLLHGNGENDPLVLQVKEARTPTVGRYLGRPEPERQQGERIVAAQQLMQTASDPMLGWTRIDGRDYLVRQFRDMKGSVDATALKKNQIDDYGRLVGALLARAHCRSLDPRLLAGYLGNGEQIDHAMVEFAFSYADQTERDHAALVAASEAGRVPTI